MSRPLFMQLSFWANVILGIIVLVCGAIASFNLYFAIPAALAGMILIWGNIKTHGTEKSDFRKKIIQEALDSLGFVLDPNIRNISHGNWSGKTDESKTDLLGKKEYSLWKEFFDSIDARNQDFQTWTVPPWEIFEKVNDRIVTSLLKIYSEIPWVKESGEAKTRIDAFKEKARETAGISESLRAELRLA